MAKVKMRISVGTIDQSQLGLPAGCVDGAVVKVSEKQRLLLVERGWAEDVKEPSPAAAQVRSARGTEKTKDQ